MGKHSDINQVVSDYKSGVISNQECMEFLIKEFMPLFVSKKKMLAKVSTDHRTIGSFKDVYIQAIHDSLENFNFKQHDGFGENRLSFVAYFSGLFGLRTASYMKVLKEELDINKMTLYIDSLKCDVEEIPDQEDFRNRGFKSQDLVRKLGYYSDFGERDLEEFLKTILDKREYRIFWFKMKGMTNEDIGNRLKVQATRNQVGIEWNQICDKIKLKLAERMKDA